MIIIGSTAIKIFYPDFPREPKDCDVISDLPKEEVYKILNITTHKNKPISLKKKIEVLSNPIIRERYKSIPDKNLLMYLPPNYIYTLKCSHTVGWNINWEKHVWDIYWLREKGCKLDMDLFKKLYAYWGEVHSKPKKSDLSLSPDDFFDNAITYPVDHDKLHEYLNPEPSYKKILKNNGTVETSEELWNSLSYQEKIDVIQEEVMVMGTERYNQMDYRSAYSRMLKKLIINHLPVWQSLFAVQNHKELLKLKFNYFTKIEDGIRKDK